MNQKPANIEQQLLHLTSQLLRELKQERALRALSLEAHFERELGIGSLEKAELFRRIEECFDIQLPEDLLAESQNLTELTSVISTAGPTQHTVRAKPYPALPAIHVDTAQAQTLVEVLTQYADEEPDRPHIYLQDEYGQEKTISYGTLYNSAKSVAKNLNNHGLQPQQTVAIMLPSNEEFFFAFFGVLIAGGIPVPIYPPFRAHEIEEYCRREAAILNNAQTSILITFEEVEALSHMLKGLVEPLTHIVRLPELMIDNEKPLTNITLNQDAPALIQYTSGSTGDPKGVLLSHQNLLENIRALGVALNITPTDSIVSWLPLYHDMGLIGVWLGALYFGVPATIMSPLSFLTHPEKWLWAMHYHRATLTVAPNFAYELCLSKIPDKKLEGLDLSELRICMNGAEVIYPKTLSNFYKRFKKYGLRESALCPAYGLAECSVGLAISHINTPPTIDCIDREIFDTTRRAVPANKKDRPVHEFVVCGSPLPKHEVRIVDDQGTPLPERTEGHLHFKGPSMMQGYYKNPSATEAITYDGWYDSGDYAYITNGSVVITGREKDIIIKAGRNLYPQEIEEIVGDLEHVRKGCVAAIGHRNSKRGTEQFIIIAETHATNKDTRQQIHTNIVERIATRMGLPPDEVLMVPPGTILKTSSGKLQRNATKKRYIDRKLIKRPLPSKLQYLKFASAFAWAKIKNGLKTVLRTVYTGYLLTIFIPLILILYPAIRIVSPLNARRVTRFICRTFLFLAFCPPRVQNEQNTLTKPQKPRLFVANHASYMDSLLLIASLSTNVLFVGKKELLSAPIVGRYFQACGYLSVDRMDFTASLKDIDTIKAAYHAGNDIMIFPEGTFAYAIGVRPFKLGAFNLAVETDAPICTIGIKGTRQFLRANTKLFIPSTLTVEYGNIHEPQNSDFSEAVRLRDLTRYEICKLCDELPINLVRAGPDES